MTRPFRTSPMRKVPSREASIVPRPPVRAAPPMITAAMTSSSYPTPPLGSALPELEERRRLREARHREPGRDPVGRSSVDAQRAQRDDDGGDAQKGGENAVCETHSCSRRKAGKRREPDVPA